MSYEPDWLMIAGIAAGAFVGFLWGKNLGPSEPKIVSVPYPIIQGLTGSQKIAAVCCLAAVFCVVFYAFANRYSINADGKVLDRMTGTVCGPYKCYERK